MRLISKKCLNFFVLNFVSEGGNQQEQQDAYDSYQSLLQNIITVSTLLMGFIITGALISLQFTGEESFNAAAVVDFIRAAFKAFMLALLSFSLSLILTILGTQIHATPTCGASVAARFLSMFGFITLASELSLYGCANSSLDFIGKYVFLNYESPAIALCPGTGTKTTHKENKFCALVGADLYDAAVDTTICGLPQSNASFLQRPYNPSDPNSRLCMQLDAYYYDQSVATATKLRKLWFGWDIPASFKQPGNETDVDIVAENAKILGEAMCGKTEGLVQGAKDKCKKNPGSVECATLLQASIAADTCAGEKYDDVIKCHRACGWAEPWGWLGIFIHEHTGERHVPIKAAFDPIYCKITQLQACISTWMYTRIAIWILMNVYTGCCRVYLAEVLAENDEDDDDYDEEATYTGMGMKIS